MSTRAGDAASFLDAAISAAPSEKCVIWPFATTRGLPVISQDGRVLPVRDVLVSRKCGPRPGKGYSATMTCDEPLCVNPQHAGMWNERKRQKGICIVTGCGHPVRSSGKEHCERHYYQVRRNGYIGPIQRPDVIDQSDGYKLIASPGHALTTEGKRYRVYEHRLLVFSETGDVPLNCVCCGKEMRWSNGDVCVCRTNDDPAENEVGALEIKCRACALEAARAKQRDRAPLVTHNLNRT